MHTKDQAIGNILNNGSSTKVSILSLQYTTMHFLISL